MGLCFQYYFRICFLDSFTGQCGPSRMVFAGTAPRVGPPFGRAVLGLPLRHHHSLASTCFLGFFSQPDHSLVPSTTHTLTSQCPSLFYACGLHHFLPWPVGTLSHPPGLNAHITCPMELPAAASFAVKASYLVSLCHMDQCVCGSVSCVPGW